MRARLVDARGRPASFAALRLVAPAASQPTCLSHADRDGRFAVVLRPGPPAPDRFRLQVWASPDPQLLEASTLLELGELRAGERRDLGTVELIVK